MKPATAESIKYCDSQKSCRAEGSAGVSNGTPALYREKSVVATEAAATVRG